MAMPHAAPPHPPPPPRSTLVVTEECLLHPSRNPHYGKANIERVLKEYLGLEKIIWLWKGVAGDDSVVNGHVDNFCCFISPGVVALAWPNDDKDFNDPQWEISMDAYERLSNTTGAGVWGSEGVGVARR